jgi:tetratricopeptide (TPR) repeat protein
MSSRQHHCHLSRLATAFSLLLMAVAPAVVTAQVPKAEDLWVGIEIGSTGVKPIVLGAFKSGTGQVRLKDIHAGKEKDPKWQPQNTSLTKGMVQNDNKEWLFDADRITDTVNAVKTFKDQACKPAPAGYGVAPDHVFVVASSGVFKKSTKIANFSILEKGINALQCNLDKLDTPELEVRYLFKYVVEGKYSDKPAEAIKSAEAFVIDIGGGNTKFGYIDKDGQTKWGGAEDYGSGTLLNAATRKLAAGNTAIPDFIKAIESVGDEVKKALSDSTERKNGESNASLIKKSQKRKVYLGGGAAWAMAAHEALWEDTNHVALSLDSDEPIRVDARMVDAFLKRVDDQSQELYVAKDSKSERAQSEAKNVNNKEAFPTRRNLIAASRMLKWVFETFELKATGPDMKEREVFVLPNSHIVWITGYVEDQRKKVLENTPATMGSVEKQLGQIDQRLSTDKLDGRLEIVSNDLKKLDSRLEEISGNLQKMTDQLKRIADRPVPPPPPVVDLSPLEKELAAIRKRLESMKFSPDRIGSDDPLDGWDHFQRGLSLYRAGRYEDAQIRFDMATQASKNEATFWYGLALAQDKLGLRKAARISAWRVAEIFARNSMDESTIAPNFERVQGPDRVKVNEYIRTSLSELSLGHKEFIAME